MEKSRTKNSIYNMIASLSSNTIAIIIGIIARGIFIKILGKEYLGLNGLFTNIITMLGIVELGIGSAIIYNLYKPIATNDRETIKSLMHFYKKSYHIIAVIVSIIGLLIIPFLPSIIGKIEIDVSITFIYILFLMETVFSYFLSYKRSLLNANQKNYYIQIIHIVYLIVLNVLQLLLLYITKNYYLYLIIKIIMRIFENLAITLLVNKMYPFIKEKNVKKLDKKLEADIFKKVKALFIHQIGSFVINGTDNLVISKYLGIAMVGLYSNYYLIINAVQTVSKQIIDAATPSVGNLLVTQNKTKQYDVFKKMRFLNFWLATFTATCIYIVMQSFIKIWIGSDYLLTEVVLLILVFNVYQKTSRYTYASFKTAAGIFYEDRFIPIIESILNIVISIFLAKKIGLAGVFIGTIVSGLSLWCFSYPKYVYKKLFDRSYINYILETIGYIFIFLLILYVSFGASKIIILNSSMMEFLKNIIIGIIIPNVLLLLIFFRTENFKYYLLLFKRIMKRTIKRNEI